MSEIYSHQLPSPLKQIAQHLGFVFFRRGPRGFELRTTWAEITGGLALALALINWGDGRWSLHVRLPWPNMFIKLPFMRPREPKDCMSDVWGFSIGGSCTWSDLHLNWGARTRIIYMPYGS